MVFGVQCKRVYSLGDKGTLDPYLNEICWLKTFKQIGKGGNKQ